MLTRFALTSLTSAALAFSGCSTEPPREIAGSVHLLAEFQIAPTDGTALPATVRYVAVIAPPDADLETMAGVIETVSSSEVLVTIEATLEDLATGQQFESTDSDSRHTRVTLSVAAPSEPNLEATFTGPFCSEADECQGVKATTCDGSPDKTDAAGCFAPVLGRLNFPALQFEFFPPRIDLGRQTFREEDTIEITQGHFVNDEGVLYQSETDFIVTNQHGSLLWGAFENSNGATVLVALADLTYGSFP